MRTTSKTMKKWNSIQVQTTSSQSYRIPDLKLPRCLALQRIERNQPKTQLLKIALPQYFHWTLHMKAVSLDGQWASSIVGGSKGDKATFGVFPQSQLEITLTCRTKLCMIRYAYVKVLKGVLNSHLHHQPVNTQIALKPWIHRTRKSRATQHPGCFRNIYPSGSYVFFSWVLSELIG